MRWKIFIKILVHLRIEHWRHLLKDRRCRKINRIMNYFRSNELSTLCGLEVKKVEDYESGYLTDKVKEQQNH